MSSHRITTITRAVGLLSLVASSVFAQGDRPDVVVDASARRAAIQELARLIDSLYPDSAIATRTSRALVEGLRAHMYEDSSARQTAARLTSELRRVSGDPHFLVDYFVVPRRFPQPEEGPDPRTEADIRLAMQLQNFGFARVERLTGNIGYIKLDRFAAPDLAAPTAEAAMRFVEPTDALIVDLRDNGGGEAETVRLLASYFFAAPTRLSDRTGRSPESLRQIWTGVLPGPRYVDKPLFILTSARTFSAAEAFAYDLHAQKRVVIVGEKTRGGANTAMRLLLSSRFGVIIPSSRVVNPITGRNWEGGLQPDVATNASDALSAAQELALKAISPRHRDDPLTREIDDALKTLTDRRTGNP